MAYNREEMRRRMREAAERTKATLNGQFEDHFRGLRGLSKEEIEVITPDRTDEEIYEVLMETVQEATQQNIQQSELIDRVKELGSVAVAIAKKVPSLAVLL